MRIKLHTTVRVRASPRGASRKVIRCQAQPGDKVLPMLRNPADLLFLGPRVALGAVLNASQNLEQLPIDLERLRLLATDDRPMSEKQTELLMEVEDRLVTFIERGLEVENEAISVVSGIIPDDVKAALPEDLKKIVLTPRIIPSKDVPATTNDQTASTDLSGARPLATWTISSQDELDTVEFGPPGAALNSDDEEPMASAYNAVESKASAELVDIQAAVVSLRQQLTAYRDNTDPSRSNMLKLNLREATENLSLRLNQRSESSRLSSSDGASAAMEEAEALLAEVKSMVN